VGPTVGKVAQFGEKPLEHAFQILTDFRIGETNCRITPVLVHPIARGVSGRVMRITVDFNDKALLRAEEVNDAIPDHVLAPEFEAAELRAADLSPQFGFKRGAALPQQFRPIKEMRILQLRRTPPLPLPRRRGD
jgi:hypothetical protein